MPKSMFLVLWDDIYGNQVTAKYPDNASLTNEKIIKFLTSVQMFSTSSLLQIKENNNVILLGGFIPKFKAEPISKCFDFVILILNESESDFVERFYSQMQALTKKLTKADQWEWNTIFELYAQKIFQSTTQKVTFLGFPGSGKTSTKKFLFEKMNYENILTNTFKPTEGAEIDQYHLIDLYISLFDTSGQEFNRWFDKNEDTLSYSDLIIFFFSITDWQQNSLQVKAHLQNISNIKNDSSRNIKNIIVFCHKIDLLTENAEGIKNEIQLFLQPFHFPIFFTSIKDGGNIDLNRGIQLILQYYSPLVQFLNEETMKILSSKSCYPVFVLDSNFNIIINYEIPEFLHFSLKDSTEKYKLARKIARMTESKDYEFRYLIFPNIYDPKESVFLCVNLSHLFPTLSFFLVSCENLGSAQTIIFNLSKMKHNTKPN